MNSLWSILNQSKKSFYNINNNEIGISDKDRIKNKNDYYNLLFDKKPKKRKSVYSDDSDDMDQKNNNLSFKKKKKSIYPKN